MREKWEGRKDNGKESRTESQDREKVGRRVARKKIQKGSTRKRVSE